MLIATAVIGGTPVNGQQQIWIEGDGFPSPQIESLDIKAHNRNGVGLRFSAQRNESSNTMRFSADISGAHAGDIVIDVRKFPRLDLGSYRTEFDGRKKVIWTLRYGEENLCFVNDDGRSRIEMVFQIGAAPKLYNIQVSNCNVSTLEIPSK
jgi:hypothetical protein